MDAPTRLGPYSLLKKLASGSALETHLARRAPDTEIGGELVLRKLRPNVVRNADAVAVFRREVESAVGLDHANLGQVFGLVTGESDVHAIAVEFVWGEDLRRIAERGMTVGRFMPVEIAVRIAIEVAEALSYLHERRDAAGASLDLLHGHVSPANIMVSFAGSVKLVDFGIARAEEQLAETIGARRRQMKYAYMSPEQVEGGRIDHRSDLFSLGTVLYEYTTRKRLFKGSDEVSTMKLVAEADVKAPSASIPSFPPGLERIVLKALSKDPADRYQTALALRDDLQVFLREEGLAADRAALSGYMTGIFPDRIKEYEKLLGDSYSGPQPERFAELAADLSGRGEAAAAPREEAKRPARLKPPPLRAARRGPADSEAPGKAPLPMPDINLPPLPPIGASAPEPPADKAPENATPEPKSSPADQAAGRRPPALPVEEEPGPDEPEQDEPEQGWTTGEDEDDALQDNAEEEEDDDEKPRRAEPSGPSVIPLPAGVQIREGDRPDGEVPAAVPSPVLLRRDEADSNVITAVHTLRQDMPDAFEEAVERSRTVIKAVLFAVVLAIGFVVWYGVTHDWPWEDIEPRPELPEVEPRPLAHFPETISVAVRSEPAGAAVSVNGVIAEARTPGVFALVPDEPNTLVFYMDGFATQVLDIAIGSQPPPNGLEVTLSELVQPADWEPPPPDPESDAPPITEWAPPRGRINVSTDPSGATILHNGVDVCQAPCEFEVVAEQEQHLTARLEGYLDTVALTSAFPWDAENDTRFLRLTLREEPAGERLYSYIELNSTPGGARVRMNGDSSGRTQINDPLRIEQVHRIELEPPPHEPDYHPWARTFYPIPGRWNVSPVMERIRRDPAQLSLFIDTPGLEETMIYMGPNEIGSGSVDLLQIDSGTYELTLSYTPPPDAGTLRRRTLVEVELPMGRHVTTHYAWDGERFVLVERTEGPLLDIEDE